MSAYSADPATTGSRLSRCTADIQITATKTGWKVVALATTALSCALLDVFWQQPCEADIPICSHWFFITRQQVRSSAFICTVETMQAIAGVRYDTSNRTTIPSWRIIFIRQLRIADLVFWFQFDSRS